MMLPNFMSRELSTDQLLANLHLEYLDLISPLTFEPGIIAELNDITAVFRRDRIGYSHHLNRVFPPHTVVWSSSKAIL